MPSRTVVRQRTSTAPIKMIGIHAQLNSPYRMIRVAYVNDDFRFGAFCPSVLGVPLLSVSLGRRASPSFWCSVDRFGCFVVVVGLIGSLTIYLLDRLTGEAVSRSIETLLLRFV